MLQQRMCQLTHTPDPCTLYANTTCTHAGDYLQTTADNAAYACTRTPSSPHGMGVRAAEAAVVTCCRDPKLMNPRGCRHAGPGDVTMMAYPMQRMTAFKEPEDKTQLFGLCLRVCSSFGHSVLGTHCTIFSL